MHARDQLNVIYFSGCLVVAATIGYLLQSSLVFLLALAVMLVIKLQDGAIRPTRPQDGASNRLSPRRRFRNRRRHR